MFASNSEGTDKWWGFFNCCFWLFFVVVFCLSVSFLLSNSLIKVSSSLSWAKRYSFLLLLGF